ncbi:hypothetical protein TSTA_038470 [Talaromyces stipitatus ATCC 10500]|uniref:Uncharacterized protein n=1 Tax=Talaromyces stipitatus (strain ATCC 10500 / CBS 375.48 / QM 6759 / NRRL 1006) TaxID=441959 RepID=B8M8X8_TALSN|nr:uncharacterized protein TSTA_038470 [Talaromyces stipitatus ATCC 10500]EED20641.1 hypothetical protein TSTA_038470 [Talaromyces stipitatus ATCC 10500]
MSERGKARFCRARKLERAQQEKKGASAKRKKNETWGRETRTRAEECPDSSQKLFGPPRRKGGRTGLLSHGRAERDLGCKADRIRLDIMPIAPSSQSGGENKRPEIKSVPHLDQLSAASFRYGAAAESWLRVSQRRVQSNAEREKERETRQNESRRSIDRPSMKSVYSYLIAKAGRTRSQSGTSNLIVSTSSVRTRRNGCQAASNRAKSWLVAMMNDNNWDSWAICGGEKFDREGRMPSGKHDIIQCDTGDKP